MFSNINEAWGRDPVKEMTEKLSKGAFQSQTSHSNIFNFKNQNNLINNDKTALKDVVSLSDNSINLLSENTTNSDYSAPSIYSSRDMIKGLSDASEYSSYAPVNFGKYSKNKKNKLKNSKHPSVTSIDFSDTDTSDSNFLDSVEDSRCTYSIKHLKKCDRCYYKLKRMVDSKVNKKIDAILLDTKMKQLQNTTSSTIQPSVPYNQTNGISDSWKEVLIIIIGAIIAIFIIFLIVKSLNK